MTDLINSPPHYTDLTTVDGLDCVGAIDALCLAYDYCLGCAIKYCWRAGRKADEVQDLQKALWYCNRLIKSGVDEGALLPYYTIEFADDAPIAQSLRYALRALSCHAFRKARDCIQKRLTELGVGQ